MKTRLTTISLSFFFLVCSPLFADEVINKSCVSKSGNSIYDISLNITKRKGEIRYRFFEQDIFYSATITSVEGSKTKGIAEFKDSRTGEDKGRPWVFLYDSSNGTLLDNDFMSVCK